MAFAPSSSALVHLSRGRERAALEPHLAAVGQVGGHGGEGDRQVLDLGAREVLRAGESIHLTRIEFRLLTALVRGHGKVITHRQLLTAIWGSLLLGGGVLGLIGCLPGWWWVERAGVLAAGTGAAIYLVVILSLHASTPGSRLVQAGFVALTLVWLAVRWLRIRGAQLDPMRGPRDH